MEKYFGFIYITIRVFENHQGNYVNYAHLIASLEYNSSIEFNS